MQANTDEDDIECTVCCEKYTPVRRKKITCGKCKFNACMICTKKYLIDTKDEPHCMNCKEPYEQRFITENLNKTYVKNDLRQHEKKQVIETEMCKMLDTQKHVPAYLEEKKYREEFTKIAEEERKAILEIRKNAREKMEKLESTHKKNKIKKESVKFKYPCPVDECRGFISLKGHCGICECKVCTKCNQIMDAEHECNPNDIASFELIKKETKPCPKCGERIQKISGCDQMWCAAEKTPGQPCGCLFSWKTGQIETGKVNHNPEYYKFIKTHGLQIRNPGDIVCGGLIPFHMFNGILSKIPKMKNMHYVNEKFKDIFDIEKFKIYSKYILDIGQTQAQNVLSVLSSFHRAIGDLTYILQRLRTTARGDEETNLRLRIQYSVKEITEKEFQKKIMKIHTDKKKAIELLKPLELYNTIGIEQINCIRDNTTEDNIIRVCNIMFNTAEFIDSELLKSQEGFTGKKFRVRPNFIVRKPN